MHIYIDIIDRTVRRRFGQHQRRRRPLTVPDHTLGGFGFQVTADDMRTFFVRVVRKFGSVNAVLGTAAEPGRRRGVGEGPRRARGGAGRTQDRPAHHLVRVGSGKADHVASPCRERRAGVSRRPHYRSPVRLLVRRPRAGRAAWPSHARWAAHPSVSGHHEWYWSAHRRTDAWAQASGYGCNPRASRRCSPARRCRKGSEDQCRVDGEPRRQPRTEPTFVTLPETLFVRVREQILNATVGELARTVPQNHGTS